jgi:hypothetical protein
LVPFKISKVEESPIIDVYQYQKQAPKGSAKVEKLVTVGSDPKSDARIESKIGFTKQDRETIKLTAKLIERRDQVKQLFGDKYSARVNEVLPMIQKEIAENGHDSPINAVISLSEKMGFSEITVSILLACAADMMEGKIKPIDAKGGDNGN